MADNQNPYDFRDIYNPKASTTTTTAPPGLPASAPSNPYDFSKIYSQPTLNTENPNPANPGNPYDFRAVYNNTPAVSPEEDDESDRFTQMDPGANWLEKSWTIANKPLTETLFGWGHYRQGAGGIERFLEKTATGLTAPLSIAALAAFAPAGIAESVAGNVLKEGLTEGAEFLGGEAINGIEAAAKVETYAKAVKAAEQAQIAGRSLKAAVQSVGMDNQEFINYGEYLMNQGLHPKDMLSEGLMRRGISRSLAASGVIGPKQALNVAKGVESLVNLGFSIQAVQGAMYAYPRALDKLADGDYDGASEAILEAGANTIFGTLGIAHTFHGIGDLLPGVNAKNQLPLTDEVENFKRIFGPMEGKIADDQFKIEARRKQQAAAIFKVAGLSQYAEALEKIPSTDKYSWGKEFGQLMRNLVANKEHREALAQKQMEFFAALDNGMKPDLASQEIAALGEGFSLEDWIKAQGNIPVDVMKKRTLQSIADEEANNLLYSKDQLNKTMGKIRGYDDDINTLHQALKDSKGLTPEETKAIQSKIEDMQNLRNEAQFSLPRLREEFQTASDWDRAKKRFQVYENWKAKIQDETTKNPNDAQLAVENRRRMDALDFRIGREFEHLYKKQYDLLNQRLDEAAKGIEPKANFDRNALDEFNKKVRDMAISIHDIPMIEKAFPHFRGGTGVSPDFEVPEANRVWPPKPPEQDAQYIKNRIASLETKLQEASDATDKYYDDIYTKKPPINIAEEEALKYAEDQFREKGDRFATASEMESIRQDPIGHLDRDDSMSARIDARLRKEGYANWEWSRGYQYRFDNDPTYIKLNEKAVKLGLEQERLKYLDERNLPSNYIGQVHQLPDGSKVLWITGESLRKFNRAINKRQDVWGYHIPRSTVDYALRKLELLKHPDIQLMELLKQGRNAAGDITLSLVPGEHGGKLTSKINTLREELIHTWQGSLSGTVADNHLTKPQYDRLRAILPKAVADHLKNHRYKMSDTPSVIVEAAAKMMAKKNLADLGITPEEAAKFLHEYFTEIRKNHGDNALDNLTHITKYAKELKDKFIASYRQPEPISEPPRPGEGQEPVEAVGGEGGGGPAGPPTGGGEGGSPYDPEWRKKFPLEGGEAFTKAFPIPQWLNAPLHPSLPTNIEELVEKARAKVHTPEQIEYVKNYIKALARVARQDFTPQEMEIYKQLRKADDDNWAVGYNNGIIKSIVDDHVHHIWGEDERKGYPVIQRAGSGAFAINASQARHRSWATAFEGIIKGRRLAVHDPSSIIAHDANNIAQAAGHRGLLDTLFNSKLKAPDGRPLGTFMGQGIRVTPEDGTQAKELINPNILRKIEMDELEIQHLKDAGLLDRYLKDGEIVDRTAYVNQNNVREWIKSTKDKLVDLIKKNPLLGDPRNPSEYNPNNRAQHEAGWGQAELFAKQQAEKIAAYLAHILPEVRASFENGKYKPVDLSNKPLDISMGNHHTSILHGVETRTILPTELDRLERYQQRNENYAQGLNGRGTGPMSPADVARMLFQERSHLTDTELGRYLTEIHDRFVPLDEKGNSRYPGMWDAKTLDTAVYHIAHAALNKEYPQLIQDLDDLNYVDKNFTSPNDITRKLHEAEAMKRLQDINDRQPKKYLWNPKGYIPIDHPAFTDWKWMATMPDKTPVLASSHFAVHPEIYDYLVNRLGLERSKLRENKGIGKVTAPLLKAGQFFKGAILSGSPFHVIQEMLRGVMLGINPFIRPNPIEDINELFPTSRGNLPLLRLGIENSLNIYNNRFMAEDAAVGVAQHVYFGDLIHKIPVVKNAATGYERYANQIHDFLFSRYIPSLKASGFKRMFEKYAEAHPDWSNDAVAYAAAQHVNNAFGGINWREFGRSATTQDLFHLVALAPDWLESEMRFAAQLFNNVGIGPLKYKPDSGRNFTREQVAYVAGLVWASARVLNLLYSGNAHFETPFGLATKDKDGREIEFSVRTMPTDILHMASDPMGFLNGRMSPLLRTEEEVRTGRNQYGQKLTPGEKYVDMVSNLIPIWGQQIIKEASGLSTSADVPGYAQIARAGGFTSQVYRTPAQKTAANLAAERSEEGSMNPAKIARHRLLLQLEDDMRSNRITIPDLEQMVSYGNLPIADAKAVIKNVQETAGQDPETARLYSRVSRLDFQGAMAVWDDANQEEKKVLEKLIRKKAASYLKKSITDFTPDERAKDPMFKRARQIAPILEEAPAQ